MNEKDDFHVVSLIPSEVKVTSMDQVFLERVKAIVEENITDEDFNVGRLSEMLNMGSSTLSKKLKALTGVTPGKFILSYRLERGAQLLKNDAGNISEVAIAVGFSNPQHFSKLFKERFNQTPSVFRRFHQEKKWGPVVFSIAELDRELIARGAQTLSFQKFSDDEGGAHSQRSGIIKDVYKLYDSNSLPDLNPALKAFTTEELVKKIRQLVERTRAKSPSGWWEEDNRLDFFEIDDSRVRMNASSVAAVCKKSDLLPDNNGYYELKCKLYGHTYNLCDSEEFYNQPNVEGRICTGVLVADDVLVTAAHCVAGYDISDLRFVFGYVMQDSLTASTKLPQENIYRGVKNISRESFSDAEYAFIQLDRKVEGRATVPISEKDIFLEQPVYIIGHPCGLPLKYAPGAHVGQVLDDYFLADLNVYSGNSGSPVFCAETHELIGIVVNGKNRDFRWTGKCWTSVIYLKEDRSAWSKCTRVSEFGMMLKIADAAMAKIKSVFNKQVDVDIFNISRMELKLYVETNVQNRDLDRDITESGCGEIILDRLNRKNFPIEMNGSKIVLKDGSTEVLVIRPDDDIEILNYSLQVFSDLETEVIVSQSELCWKMRTLPSDIVHKKVSVMILEGGLKGDSIKPYSSDFYESELRYVIAKGLYEQGKEYLDKAIKISPEKEERLKNEFGFIDFDNPGENKENWTDEKTMWRRKAWTLLAGQNDFIDGLKGGGNDEVLPVKELEQGQDELEGDTSESNYNRKGKHAQQLGAELEYSVLELFKRFLEMCNEECETEILYVNKNRKQPSTLQFGYDLAFNCRIKGNRELKLRIECKNYDNKVYLRDIADKLYTAKRKYRNDRIDHWILVAPFDESATDLDDCVGPWEKEEEFPFKVQLWDKNSNVTELFGLVPEIYDLFFKPGEGDIHPREWDDEKRRDVLKHWNQKLAPPIRLPGEWPDYLRRPGRIKLPDEKDFEALYNNGEGDFVPMDCEEETGAKLGNLEANIMKWLNIEVSKSPTLFLLGEFGDGKSFFTYMLARKLIDSFRESPKTGWIPVRFALKNFKKGAGDVVREFLRNRLDDFDIKIPMWNDLRDDGYKIVAILDGFDEISKELDPETVQENIDILIECFESDYFCNIKLIITSRKHFFENQYDKKRLIDKLKNPPLLHLAPISRNSVKQRLKKYAEENEKNEELKSFLKCHDTIGLAQKPLFLQMAKSSLARAQKNEVFNEYSLYENYIADAIERKLKFNYDKKTETSNKNLGENLINVLMLIAQTLCRENNAYVYLSDIRAEGKKYVKWLWDFILQDEKAETDETARTATRSLLKRVYVKDQPENKNYPVDFCHRSMSSNFATYYFRPLIISFPKPFWE